MKLRLVRTTIVQKAPRYAVLFADGTMVCGLNFSRPKTMSGEAEETAKAKVWREVSCRILRDVLTHYDEYKRLSAENYGIDDTTFVGRWDSADCCGNMSLWGSNNYATELIVTDAGQLCVYNPLLTAFARSESNDDFAFEERPEVNTKANTLKMRLVKTGTTLRDGLYLLWANGVREQVRIDETDAEAAKKVIDIMSNYINADQRMAPDAESADDDARWDKDDQEPVSIDEWRANYTTVFAVTGDNYLCVKDPTVLQTLNLAASRETSVSFDGARTVTPLQYCYLALQAGVFDKKLDDAGIMMDHELHQPLNPANTDAFEKKLKNYRIRVLKVLKQSYDHKIKSGTGFPFAEDNSRFTKEKNGDIEWYLPVYYPGDPEYEKAFGQFNVKPEEVGRPCLPRYPTSIGTPENYDFIRITETIQQRFEEYLAENSRVKANKGRGKTTASSDSENMPVYNSIEYTINRNNELNAAIKNAQEKGLTTSQEIADALFEEYAGAQKNKARFRQTIEARLDTVPNKKRLFYTAALNCNSLEEISEKVQYSKGYVHKLLSSLKDGQRGKNGYEVGPDVYRNFSAGVRRDLELYDAVKEAYKTDKSDKQIAGIVGITSEEAAEIRENLVQ